MGNPPIEYFSICPDYGTIDWANLLSSSTSYEQDQATWDKYLKVSQEGQNLRIDYPVNKFTFVKDVAVGEEIFISNGLQLLVNAIVSYQTIISACQDGLVEAKILKVPDNNKAAMQQLWDLDLEPAIAFDVTKDTYEVAAVHIFGAKTSPENPLLISAVELSRWIKKLTSLVITLKSENETSDRRYMQLKEARNIVLKKNLHVFKLKF